MTTVSEIVTGGFREGNTKAIVSTLSTEETTEGLGLLQNIVDSFFGMVIGTKPVNWYIPRPQRTGQVIANYPASPGEPFNDAYFDVNYPPPNARLLMKNATAETVYFQYHPQDGALIQYVDAGHTADVTFDANGMLFGDLTEANNTVTVTARFPANGRNAPRTYIFRADWASWVQVPTLVLTDDFPFPDEFNDYFICALAMRLAPRFGKDPREGTMLRYSQMLTNIRGKYRQMSPAVVGDAGVPADQAYLNRSAITNPDRGY